jgi:hypothetical protein
MTDETTVTLVNVGLKAPMLDAVDLWRKNQLDRPSRQQAIRVLAGKGLASEGVGAAQHV